MGIFGVICGADLWGVRIGIRVRVPQYEVDHRGFLGNHNSSSNNNNNNNSSGNGFLGKNAFQIPTSVNMAGSNQYHLFSQCKSLNGWCDWASV
jgi:hypothetical protein